MNLNQLIIVIILCLIIGFPLIIMYNNLIKANERIKKSKSNIDVFLKKRFDLIPNIERAVKGYVKHEKEVLTELTELRGKYEKDKDIKTANDLNEKISSLIMLAEDNPDLKASELFLDLQKQLSNIEDEIQAVRRIYNHDVAKLNTMIKQVPYVFFNIFLKYKEQEFLKFDSDQIKENINVDFN